MRRIAVVMVALMASSAEAQTINPSYALGKGETLLQVQATGRVMRAADRIALSCTVAATGKTDAEARAGLSKERDRIAKLLVAQQVAATYVALLPGWQARPGLLRGLGDMAAMAGAASESGDEETPPKRQTTTLRVNLASVDRIEPVRETLAEACVGNNVAVDVGLADRAAPMREAKDLALVNAAKEAEAFAAKLGLRIVRVIRVSEASASFMDMLGPDYKNLMTTMTSALAGSRNDAPGQVATEATLTVDYLAMAR